MTLTITEEWIRDRVQLKDENLEDVKSLAVPGTYHEKISQLGNALFHFTRLKELDLSRNALEYLDGLQHLTLLESLNLYYNNIGILNEVHKLRFNSKLQELDLRLNPVARNEPDYRLFAIHMLPNLRRLDDRGVRDQERKAALMHFGTDQAAEFSDEKELNVVGYPSNKGDRETIPRAQYVSKLSAVPPIETDDSALIDYARALDAPRQNGGSRVENYDRRELLHLERENGSNSNVDRANESSNFNNHTGFAGVIDQYYPSLKSSGKLDSRLHSPVPAGISRGPNDHGSMRGTPPPSNFGGGGLRDSSAMRVTANNSSSQNPKVTQVDARTVSSINRLCDLVDRYWNGTRSLHNHPKFLPTAVGILSELSSSDQTWKQDTSKSHIVNDLEKEIDELRIRLRRLEHENHRLRESKDEKMLSNNSHGNESLGDIERDNERLRSEVNTMRVKMRAYEQTNELATMLRESHKALVETNDQLMRELTDARQTRTNDNWHASRMSGPYNSEDTPVSRPHV